MNYTVRLRGYQETVDVPDSVRGIDNVADYITRYLADKYARALWRNLLDKSKQIESVFVSRRSENWYDSHYDFILSEIQALARETVRELRA